MKYFCCIHNFRETFISADKLCIIIGYMNCSMLVNNYSPDISDVCDLNNLKNTPTVLNPALIQLPRLF